MHQKELRQELEVLMGLRYPNWDLYYIYIYCKPTYTGGAFVPFFLNKEGLLEDHHVWHTF